MALFHKKSCICRSLFADMGLFSTKDLTMPVMSIDCQVLNDMRQHSFLEGRERKRDIERETDTFVNTNRRVNIDFSF